MFAPPPGSLEAAAVVEDQPAGVGGEPVGEVALGTHQTTQREAAEAKVPPAGAAGGLISPAAVQAVAMAAASLQQSREMISPNLYANREPFFFYSL